MIFLNQDSILDHLFLNHDYFLSTTYNEVAFWIIWALLQLAQLLLAESI